MVKKGQKLFNVVSERPLTEIHIIMRMRHLTSDFDLTLASNMQTIKNVL